MSVFIKAANPASLLSLPMQHSLSHQGWWSKVRAAVFATPNRPIFLLIALLLLIRLVMMPFVLLIPEEAYYWLYCRYPSMGYLDHPPMVAWMVSFGRLIFGDTEIGVRFGAWTFAIGSTFVCYHLTSEWSGRRAGAIAALLFNLSPLLFGIGFMTTPDPGLVFFWFLTLWFVTRACHSGRQYWWWLAGVSTGLAFDSKYTALFLIGSTFLFLLFNARYRRLLVSPGPWLAVVLAAVVASPVIWWNATHEWASFKFQLSRRVSDHHSFVPGRTLAWLGLQFLLLSPVVFIVLTNSWVMAIRRFRRGVSERWRFAACFSIPWLAICVWHGLSSKVHINWPIPAYLSLLVVAPLFLRLRGLGIIKRISWSKHRKITRHYVIGLVVVNFLALLYVGVRSPYLPRPTVLSPWGELGVAAELVEDCLEDRGGTEPFIVTGGRYNLASELAFYMREGRNADDWYEVVPAGTLFGGGLNFVNWHSLDEFHGRNAVFIAEDVRDEAVRVLEACFSKVDSPRMFYSHITGMGETQKFYVIDCWGFQGNPDSSISKP